MGLTIQYSLKARGIEPQARKLITALHQAAADLPFAELGHLIDLSGDECNFERRAADDPLRWYLVQAQELVAVKGPSRRPGGGVAEFHYRVTPTRVLGFTAWPGAGCEESNVGLCRYPATFTTPEGQTLKTKLSGWCWSSFCKTQYASNPECGGIANFLRCHLTVVALLDQAKALGCLTNVNDEGGFWASRDVPALAKEIGSWNEMIAAFGGKLKDVLGRGVQAPIADYPNFEQLEAAGQNQLHPETETLARLIQRVVATKGVGP